MLYDVIRYEVGFYLETPATYKFISTFMPLVFVVLLALLNVLNGEGEGPDIENSIALCLAVVFILPELRHVQQNPQRDIKENIQRIKIRTHTCTHGPHTRMQYGVPATLSFNYMLMIFY